MSRNLWIATLAGVLLLWLAPLGSYRLFNPDEGRYAEIPREMLASGDWVTPRLDGLKYFEKPPLQYWFTAAAYSVFGVHEWTARAWTALSAIAGLLLTAWLALRLYGREVALLATAVQAGALMYVSLARILTLDMGLCFTLEFALAGLLLLVREGRTQRDERLGAGLLALGVVLAFLAKGLVGILLPGAVAALYMLWKRDYALLLRARPWWTAAALVAVAGPWVWLVEQRNPGFASFFFVHEHFARFLTRVHQRYEPDWFFIPVLLLGFMPWTPLLPAIARAAWTRVRSGDPLATMLSLWVVFGFGFFSVSQSKLAPYILPLFPALALLAGEALHGLDPRQLRRALGFSAAAGLVPGVAAAALCVNPAWAVRLGAGAGRAPLYIAGGFLLASILLAWAARLCATRGPRPAVLAAALGNTVLAALLIPGVDKLPRSEHVGAMLRELQGRLDADTPFYCVGTYVQSLPFYLGRTCTLVEYRGELDYGLSAEPRKWVPTVREFAAQWRADGQAVAVVHEEWLDDLWKMGLPMRVLYTGPTVVLVAKQ